MNPPRHVNHLPPAIVLNIADSRHAKPSFTIPYSVHIAINDPVTATYTRAGVSIDWQDREAAWLNGSCCRCPFRFSQLVTMASTSASH